MRQLRQPAIRALRKRLDYQVIAVLVDDQRREAIRFSVDKTVRRRVDVQPVAKRHGHCQTLPPDAFAGRLVTRRDHPQRDLRSRAPERTAKPSIAAADDRYQIAWRGRCRRNVASVDPGMATTNPILTAAGDDNNRGRSFRRHTL